MGSCLLPSVQVHHIFSALQNVVECHCADTVIDISTQLDRRLVLDSLIGTLRMLVIQLPSFGYLHAGSEVSQTIRERYRGDGGKNMNRLELIFKAVNAIASNKHDAATEYMLAQAVLQEIDTAKLERRAKAASAGRR